MFIGHAAVALAAKPLAPRVAAIAYAGLAGSVRFGVWAWWADRHRGVIARL